MWIQQALWGVFLSICCRDLERYDRTRIIAEVVVGIKTLLSEILSDLDSSSISILGVPISIIAATRIELKVNSSIVTPQWKMLSRAARPAISQSSCRNGYAMDVVSFSLCRLAVGQAARSMATLREIEQRLKVFCLLRFNIDVSVNPKYRENYQNNESCC